MYAKELKYVDQNDFINNLIKNEFSNDPETIILKPIYENVKTNKIITLPDASNMNYTNNENNYLYNNNNNINYEQKSYNQIEDAKNIDYNDYNNIITNPSSSMKQITNYVNMMHNKSMTSEDASNFRTKIIPLKKVQTSNTQINPEIKKVININNKINKNENKTNYIELPPRKQTFREVVKIIQNENPNPNPNIMTKKLPNIEILNNEDRQSNPIYKTMNLQESRLNLNNNNDNVNITNNYIENNVLNNTEIIKINRSTQTEEPKIDYNISIVPVDDLKNKLLKKREKDKNKGFHGVKAIKVYSPKSNSNFNYNLNYANSKSYKDFKNIIDDFNNRASNYKKSSIPKKENNIEITPTKKPKVINYIKKGNNKEFSPSKRVIVDYGRNDYDKYSKPISNGDKKDKEKFYRHSDYHSRANLSKKDEYNTPKKHKKYFQYTRPLYYDEKKNDLSNNNPKKVKNKNKKYYSSLKPKKENRPLYYYEKNNDDLDEYDNTFNIHEKFINKMKNLFDF